MSFLNAFFDVRINAVDQLRRTEKVELKGS